MTLQEYTNKVNALFRAECEEINADDPNNLFKAVHHDYPEECMSYYFKHGGYTPEHVVRMINEDAEAEGKAMRRMAEYEARYE